MSYVSNKQIVGNKGTIWKRKEHCALSIDIIHAFVCKFIQIQWKICGTAWNTRFEQDLNGEFHLMKYPTEDDSDIWR